MSHKKTKNKKSKKNKKGEKSKKNEKNKKIIIIYRLDDDNGQLLKLK